MTVRRGTIRHGNCLLPVMPVDRLLKHRIVTLTGPLTAEVASCVIERLLLLHAEDAGRQIDLYINSPGGSIAGGMAVIDAMRTITNPVSTICVGQAASMGAWVLAAGTRGLRRATENAEIILHQITSDDGYLDASAFAGGVAECRGFGELEGRARLRLDRTRHWRQRAATLLARWTGQTAERVLADMEMEIFMGPDEAVRYGLIDGVIGHRREARRRGRLGQPRGLGRRD